MDLHIEDIKMLEGPKAAQLENDRYGDDLALGHYRRALGLVADKGPVDHFAIFLAEFIDKTKNFSNFRIDYHG
jgi:hypothetical protein